MKTIIAPKQRKRYYTELRELMDAYKINQEEIAEVIGKSKSYTAKRFAGHEPLIVIGLVLTGIERSKR